MSVTPPRQKDLACMALARLKATSPQTFAEIVGLFKEMRDASFAECVQAPPDRVQIMQGKAQERADFVTLFETCTEQARALEAKMKEKK